MTRTLLIDARCLQHPDYATRGIGRHIETMLRAAPRALCGAFEVTALIDPALPPLDETVLRLFGRLTTTAYAAAHAAGAIYLNPAPLSFPPTPIAGLLRAPGVTCAAVVLDFIPLDFPELYLAAPEARREYRSALAALRRYHRFLPISQASAARLGQVIPGSADRASVTGVAVRPSLLPEPGAAPLPFAMRDREILVVSGDDHRKNPEIAAAAHGASAALRQVGISLRFVGIHSTETRERLVRLHHAAGGDGASLAFAPPLSEAALARAYAGALLLVAPSRAEGFSLPIVEAMAQGTPVLAADEAAQAELVRDEADRFAPDDARTLRAAMERLALDPLQWRSAAERQAGLWQDFTPEAVAARFWQPFLDLPAPAILRRARPRIALLSPLPPAQSGCADHSAALLASLAPLAEVTAFSDTAAPRVPDGIGFGGRADASVMRAKRFDAVIAVIGNSPLHRTEAALLRDHGGAAIVHDARLGGLYRSGFGDAAAMGIAIAEYGGAVTYAQLDAWEADQAAMPLRFLGEIAAASAPMIVHAASTAQWVATRHGIAARFIPFPPYRLPDPATLTAQGRSAARARLGIPDDLPLIVSLGHIQHDKAPETLIRVAAALHGTMRFRMAFAGSADPRLIASLRALAETLGIDQTSLILDPELVPEPAYRDYLAAADCAIQLRRAPRGSISGALMDAIAAGLPSVAAATLAEAIMPPPYVQSVPDEATPAEIAAAVRRVLGQERAGAGVAREDFVAQRNMPRYAAQLLRTVLH
jgi:glycosyltransferase involved in cell wall biosynthesis